MEPQWRGSGPNGGASGRIALWHIYVRRRDYPLLRYESLILVAEDYRPRPTRDPRDRRVVLIGGQLLLTHSARLAYCADQNVHGIPAEGRRSEEVITRNIHGNDPGDLQALGTNFDPGWHHR